MTRHKSGVQAQQLLKQRFAIRPPPLDSKLHRNMTLALSPEKLPKHTIKAESTLVDFAREHMQAVDRDMEQRKLKYVSMY
jgi:hypothetical protein